MKYNICTNDGVDSSVVVFIGSEMLTATKDHPSFTKLTRDLQVGPVNTEAEFETYIRGLFDAGVAIGNQFAQVSDRVSVNNGKVFWDGDLVDNTLTKTIVAFHAADEDFMTLVNFMEKVMLNPNEHSREQLFDWMARNNFAICPDGDFIAYKSVGHAGVDDEDRKFLSGHAGTAMVNGVLFTNKQIPNRPGTVIEMPRSKVTHNPSEGCSYGLHVANWSYGSSFTSGPTLRCKVNPLHVVSVPTDCNAQKMRVCRYQVLDVVTEEDRTLLYANALERVARNVEVGTKPAFIPDGAKTRRIVRPIVWATDGKPLYFEQYRKSDWEAETRTQLVWLAGEWKVADKLNSRMTKAEVIKVLRKEARKRLATWPEG